MGRVANRGDSSTATFAGYSLSIGKPTLTTRGKSVDNLIPTKSSQSIVLVNFSLARYLDDGEDARWNFGGVFR